MTTYAIPLGGGQYQYIDEFTDQTFSIGTLSFPPPWLRSSSPVDRASVGILAVVETSPPTGDFGSITRTIQVLAGIPTVVWVTTPYQTTTRTKDVVAAQLKKAVEDGNQTLINQLLAQLLAL